MAKAIKDSGNSGFYSPEDAQKPYEVNSLIQENIELKKELENHKKIAEILKRGIKSFSKEHKAIKKQYAGGVTSE